MLGAETLKHLLGEKSALIPRTDAFIPIVVLFILSLLAFCYAPRPGRRKWIAAKTVWPQKLPAPLKLERAIVVNRIGKSSVHNENAYPSKENKPSTRRNTPCWLSHW